MAQPEPKEQWKLLDAKDLVFTVPKDGRVVPYGAGNGMFGAIVRRREGKWMKRELPLEILTPEYIRMEARAKRFVRGSQLLAQQ